METPLIHHIALIAFPLGAVQFKCLLKPAPHRVAHDSFQSHPMLSTLIDAPQDVLGYGLVLTFLSYVVG